MSKDSISEHKSITRRLLSPPPAPPCWPPALGMRRHARGAETVRQGYQTNIWGMPTYYLLHSG